MLLIARHGVTVDQAVGFVRRSERTGALRPSSWIAYGPAIGLSVAAALAERIGGTALIAAAVGMERKDVSPVEAGRRIVDVMSTTCD